jgi:hypothetical protein
MAILPLGDVEVTYDIICSEAGCRVIASCFLRDGFLGSGILDDEGWGGFVSEAWRPSACRLLSPCLCLKRRSL